MGWSDCGEDSRGRPIGYGHEATCDHPGCSAEIHRGLAYVCGQMHGEDEYTCEGYFCHAHVAMTCIEGECFRICLPCFDRVKHLDDDFDEVEATTFTSDSPQQATPIAAAKCPMGRQR